MCPPEDRPESAGASQKSDLPLAVDPDINSDSDYGESLLSSDSQSLTSSVVNYVYENGRRYHSYAEGRYVLPNDEAEKERMDIVHHLELIRLEGRLFCAPISSNPHRVLDLGTGSGIWALDCAEFYPSAEVIGVDLSPIQPSWVWPNVRFEVDDIEAQWTYPFNHFDFIYARRIAQSIRDWPKLAKQMFDHLQPGGYVELAEVEGDVHCDDGTVKEDSALRKCFDLFKIGIAKMGIPFIKGEDLQKALETAGFVDVVVERFKEPIGPWAADKILKEVGLYKLVAAETGFESYLLAIFTRALGMTAEDATMLCKGALSDVKNKRIHSYQKVWHVYGRKP